MRSGTHPCRGLRPACGVCRSGWCGQEWATCRATPNGGFGTRVTVLSGPNIAVERSAHRGTNWEIGYTGVGSPVLAPCWHFAEGVTSDTYFQTLFVLANPSTTAVPVTLTFTKADGTPITYTVTCVTMHATR